MDIDWRKRNIPIHIRAILSLTLLSAVYIVIIWPLRVTITSEYIYPKFVQHAEENGVPIINNQRRLDIQPAGYDTPRGFGIPFGGYFWLPLALFITVRNKDAALGLTGYHIFLCIGPPYLGILFIKGYGWAGTLLQVNEMLFLGVFMFALFFGSKGVYDEWKSNQILN